MIDAMCRRPLESLLLVLIVVAATPLQAEPQAPIATGQQEPWGEPVQGVQLRVSLAAAPDTPRDTVELPPLAAEIRNLGDRTVPYNVMDLLTAAVEIDGVEYRNIIAGSCCPRSQALTPGATTVPFTLTYPNGLHTSTGSLFISPGRHTVRVKAAIGRQWVRDGTGPPPVIDVISNLLIVDVPAVDPAVERRALLEAAVRSGNAGRPFATLVEKYPDAALGAVQQMLEKIPRASSERANLIAWLYRVPGEEVMAFFRTQLGPETDFASRSSAAWNLFRRGDPRGLAAAVAAWRELQTSGLSAQSLPDRSAPIRGDNTRWAAGGLITTLANSGDVQALNALARDLRQMPLEVRMSVVGVFLQPDTGHINVMLNGGPATLPDGDAGIAIERLLIASLDDTEVIKDKRGTVNGIMYVDPRVCDLAALALATRWPERFSFRWEAETAARDRQIDAIRRAAR
jgi:hypothetical protein